MKISLGRALMKNCMTNLVEKLFNKICMTSLDEDLFDKLGWKILWQTWMKLSLRNLQEKLINKLEWQAWIKNCTISLDEKVHKMLGWYFRCMEHLHTNIYFKIFENKTCKIHTVKIQQFLLQYLTLFLSNPTLRHK